ncbi:hypothetical protein ACFE04_031008 [Oxalis oulophora]
MQLLKLNNIISKSSSSTTTPLLLYKILIASLLNPPIKQRHVITSSSYSTTTPSNNNNNKVVPVDIFKEWFTSRNNNPVNDKIFKILNTSQNDAVLDASLSKLNLRLSERTVLDILQYVSITKGDVLSCLKFFDYAGRQPNFHHTRVTFNQMFKILSTSDVMSFMLDLLKHTNSNTNRITISSSTHRVRFYDTLVMGYAVAGKPELALHLLARMRFMGLDLTAFSYHVLFNALVEEACFDAAHMLGNQISRRGFQNEVTYTLITKSLCKQNRLDEAQEYLINLVHDGFVVNGHAVRCLVDALCKGDMFERAAEIMDRFRKFNVQSMELAYGVWIQRLVQSGKLDTTIDFLRSKASQEGYVPDLFSYNKLVCGLLKENQLMQVFDLFMEMKKAQIIPDKVTMNAVLTLFCKAGEVDGALELYNYSRSQVGLSVNSMAYNCLIDILCENGRSDEAYGLLKNSIEQDLFPGKKTFLILADILCREGEIDKMKELLAVSLGRKSVPNHMYNKLITVLCRAGRVEDAYLIHSELNKVDKTVSQTTYFSLIHGFNKLSKGDIASRLLIEMQEKGYHPSRYLFRSVICCICQMKNPANKFSTLVEMQLSRSGSDVNIYNFLIDGAGHAKKPEFARLVCETMQKNGIMSTQDSDILMLQCYLKSDRIFDAVSFFSMLKSSRKIGKKVYHAMVAGLCRANRINSALELFKEMKDEGLTPSYACYEMLIQSLCSKGKYENAISLIFDLETSRGPVTSFIGNVLLLHSLGSNELYGAWKKSRQVGKESSQISQLGHLVWLFSNCLQAYSFGIADLEQLVQRCFPLDIYTYNLLLKKFSWNDIDSACELFTRMCEKGYEPNRWTYNIFVHILLKHGRTDEFKTCVKEMISKGFDPPKHLKYNLEMINNGIDPPKRQNYIL